GLLVTMAATALAVALVPASPVLGHEERALVFPPGPGSVPKYSIKGPLLVVCKKSSKARIEKLPKRVRERNLELLRKCKRDGYRSIQSAINHVTKKGSRIKILPGRYRERKTLAKPMAKGCAELQDTAVLTYEEQVKCPTLQNIITVFGDSDDEDIVCDEPVCDLQIEGTGARPGDVVLDGDWKRLNVLRADRADGIYLRNFTAQRAPFNAVYILQTDGFVIDELVGRWNYEYGFLTFASDHGLYKNCEAYLNGDGGLYPGSAAPHQGVEPSIEIRRCKSHHNTLGYSGTAGNSTYVHHNKFYKNTLGVVTDSFFPDHPGLPQNSARFVHNKIYSNNKDYYKNYTNGKCDKPFEEMGIEEGTVCPAVPVPIGVGLLIAGGNHNIVGENHIYDNWRYGTMQFWVPAALREEHDPDKQYDTSNYNRYIGNVMGSSPAGKMLPNGLDFWWDEEGAGNCWEINDGGEDGITSDPEELPDCTGNPVFSPGDSAKQAFLVPCATWSREDHHPEGCDWMEKPEKPEQPE
ncbi:MAG: right-handed parallel beta-helix repeat-containing protein, partial [Actinomycetota bacterium]|nr:right-handed parallel beta-helix repeat-containing protein [Actinomycetota bacterium]